LGKRERHEPLVERAMMGRRAIASSSSRLAVPSLFVPAEISDFLFIFFLFFLFGI
jgi:hypothetical protein